LLSPAAQLGFAKIALAQRFSFNFFKMNEAGFIYSEAGDIFKVRDGALWAALASDSHLIRSEAVDVKALPTVVSEFA
jgi:hypothetical protein